MRCYKLLRNYFGANLTQERISSQLKTTFKKSINCSVQSDIVTGLTAGIKKLIKYY